MHDERGHIAKKDEEEEEEEEEGGRDGAWWRSRAERARDLLSIGEENSANFRGTVLLKRGEGGGGGGGVFMEISSARRVAVAEEGAESGHCPRSDEEKDSDDDATKSHG